MGGESSQKKMEEMLKQGYTAKEIMKKMMTEGQTKEEEIRDTTETMKHLMSSKKKNIKTNPKDIEAMLNERLDNESKEMMRNELGESSQKKMEEMLKQGYTAKE